MGNQTYFPDDDNTKAKSEPIELEKFKTKPEK